MDGEQQNSAPPTGLGKEEQPTQKAHSVAKPKRQPAKINRGRRAKFSPSTQNRRPKLHLLERGDPNNTKEIPRQTPRRKGTNPATEGEKKKKTSNRRRPRRNKKTRNRQMPSSKKKTIERQRPRRKRRRRCGREENENGKEKENAENGNVKKTHPPVISDHANLTQPFKKVYPQFFDRGNIPVCTNTQMRYNKGHF